MLRFTSAPAGGRPWGRWRHRSAHARRFGLAREDGDGARVGGDINAGTGRRAQRSGSGFALKREHGDLPLAWFLPRAGSAAELPCVFAQRTGHKQGDVRGIILHRVGRSAGQRLPPPSCVMVFLDKQAYQQRPVYGIN